MSGPGLINMELSQLSLVLNTNIISLNHIFRCEASLLVGVSLLLYVANSSKIF